MIKIFVWIIAFLSFIDILKCLLEIKNEESFVHLREKNKYSAFFLKSIFKLFLSTGEDIFLISFVIWFSLQNI